MGSRYIYIYIQFYLIFHYLRSFQSGPTSLLPTLPFGMIDAVAAARNQVQSTSFNTSKNETLVIQKGFWFLGTKTPRFANQPLNFWGLHIQ